MIKRIARKEFVEMSRDGRFRWSAAILLVLLSASLIDGLAFFSPAILFQNAVDEITGAGQARHQHFLAQLDDYVRARDALFTSKIIRRENVRAVDIDQISRFEYR
jgi:Domain of unknown function (DUF3526)